MTLQKFVFLCQNCKMVEHFFALFSMDSFLEKTAIEQIITT